MAKVIYTPGADMPGETTNLGFDFVAGKPTEVDGPMLRKFRAHPFFKVEEDKPEDKGLHAVHKGRGVYAIMRDGSEVETGMSKADAEAFNALSEAEQRQFLGKD